jgi:hypothetical protein
MSKITEKWLEQAIQLLGYNSQTGNVCGMAEGFDAITIRVLLKSQWFTVYITYSKENKGVCAFTPVEWAHNKELERWQTDLYPSRFLGLDQDGESLASFAWRRDADGSRPLEWLSPYYDLLNDLSNRLLIYS